MRDPYLEVQKVGSALGPWVMGFVRRRPTEVTSALVPGGVGWLASVATTMLLAVTITLFVIAFVIGGLLRSCRCSISSRPRSAGSSLSSKP